MGLTCSVSCAIVCDLVKNSRDHVRSAPWVIRLLGWRLISGHVELRTVETFQRSSSRIPQCLLKNVKCTSAWLAFGSCASCVNLSRIPESVCRAMTVNNWSRGNIAEKFFQDSAGCLAVLGNIVQYFENMTAIINLHRLTNILTFRLVLHSFQAMKNAEPQFQFEIKAGIHHYIKHSLIRRLF